MEHNLTSSTSILLHLRLGITAAKRNAQNMFSNGSTSSTLYLCLSSVALCFIWTFIVHPLFLHPLRKIPRAHWSVPFPHIGELWMLYQRYKCRPNTTTYRVHQKHGDIVRLGYNELSVNCVDDGIRTVYGGGWEKHDWYARRSVCYGVINMFLTVHRTPHSQKKRTVANVYSKSYIQNSAQLMSNTSSLLADRILPLLQSISDSSETIEIHDLDTAIAMDFMTAYLFGISHSTNFIQDLAARRDVMHQFSLRRVNEFQQSEIPPQVHRWLASMHLPLVPEYVGQALHRLEAWNSSMCNAAAGYLTQRPSDETSGDAPIVYSSFTNNMTKFRERDKNFGRESLPHILPEHHNPTFQPSEAEIHAEMFDYIEAGGDGAVLTNLHWLLARNPSVQDRLHMELLSALGSSLHWNPTASETFQLPSPKALDALPFLHAIINETLRLHSSTPGAQPRVSPSVPGGVTLGQFTGIPGGVRVSAMPYALHRNPKAFPNPETWDPERWLTTDESRLKEMNKWFWAFGSGGRMCIGSHFAMWELKIVIAAIYASWRTEVVDDSGVAARDGYAAGPKKGLVLRFVKRD